MAKKKQKRISLKLSERTTEAYKKLGKEVDRTPHWLMVRKLEEIHLNDNK